MHTIVRKFHNKHSLLDLILAKIGLTLHTIYDKVGVRLPSTLETLLDQEQKDRRLGKHDAERTARSRHARWGDRDARKIVSAYLPAEAVDRLRSDASISGRSISDVVRDVIAAHQASTSPLAAHGPCCGLCEMWIARHRWCRARMVKTAWDYACELHEPREG